MLHHYYNRQDAQRDWLFEKLDNGEMIVIRNDKDEENETMAKLMQLCSRT